jgi:hypothetical protein
MRILLVVCQVCDTIHLHCSPPHTGRHATYVAFRTIPVQPFPFSQLGALLSILEMVKKKDEHTTSLTSRSLLLRLRREVPTAVAFPKPQAFSKAFPHLFICKSLAAIPRSTNWHQHCSQAPMKERLVTTQPTSSCSQSREFGEEGSS